MKKSSEFQIGTVLGYGNTLTLTKVSDASPVRDADPAISNVEIWTDQYQQQWTPTLAFEQGMALVPEFIPVG